MKRVIFYSILFSCVSIFLSSRPAIAPNLEKVSSELPSKTDTKKNPKCVEMPKKQNPKTKQKSVQKTLTKTPKKHKKDEAPDGYGNDIVLDFDPDSPRDYRKR